MNVDGLEHEKTETSATAATHPEELKAEVHLRAGPFSFEARARATPAGLIAAAVVVSAVLFPPHVDERAQEFVRWQNHTGCGSKRLNQGRAPNGPNIANASSAKERL